MNDLFNAAISAPNIIPTALVVFVLFYWLVVILGAIDIDFFDFDVELDAEADVDGEISVTWLNHVLAFFNLGQVPFMVFMTFLIIPMWVISVMGNYYLGNETFWLSLILLIPNFIVSLFIAKFLTLPFIHLFGKLDHDIEKNKSLIGKICTVITSASDMSIGQARIQTNGAPLLLNVKTPEGMAMKSGDTGMVIDYEQDRHIYLIEPYII